MRLKSAVLIESLFKNRSSLRYNNFSLFYLTHDEKGSQSGIQFLVSVSKKKFPLAVHRNQIKRRIREAVRHEKNILEEDLKSSHYLYLFAVIYTGNKMPDFPTTRVAVQQLFKIWTKKNEIHPPNTDTSLSAFD